MDSLFLNSKNSKTSELQGLLLDLWDIIDLKRRYKYVPLSNLSIYYAWKITKRSCKNNKIEISAPTWNDIFELLDRSYSVSDIRDYFEYILKKHGENTDNSSIKMYLNKNAK